MAPLVTVSHEYQREAHRTLLMQTLRRSGRASRAQLSRMTGLKRSTITSIMQEFIDANLVREGEAGASSPLGGRRPVDLYLRREAGAVIGIDLHKNGVQAVLCLLDGSIQGSVEFSLEDGLPLGSQVTAALEESRRLFSSQLAKTQLLAYGLGISGTVDPGMGIIKNSHIHRVSQFPLAPWVEGFDVPVLVENDANCGAWAEIIMGGGSSNQLYNALYVLPRLVYNQYGRLEGVELGGSVIVDGAVWYGSRFITGEFSLASWFKEGVERAAIDYDLLLRIDRDRQARRSFFLEVCRKLSAAARMLDPDTMIFGGVFKELAQTEPEHMAQTLPNSWFSEAEHAQRIRPAAASGPPAAVGAAAYVLAKLYRTPSVGTASSQFDISWDYVLSSLRRPT